MTLRARLLSVTVAMVAIVVIALVGLNLNSLISTWVGSAADRAEDAGRQVQASIVRRIERGVPAPAAPLTIPEVKDLWMQAIAKDAELDSLLEQTMAQSRSIIEIDVAGEDGEILASSNPERRGTRMRARTDLGSLRDAEPAGRFRAVLDSAADYQTTVPLGIPGQNRPVFTVQVLSSLILLRAAIEPAMRQMEIVSALAFAAAILLAWWAAAMALRPLRRVEHLIDEIGTARERPADAGAAQSGEKELEVIESKLSLLGERFRSAREDATRLRSNLNAALGKLDAETRRQLESELMLSRRLTAINSLTGRVAHEIKNPLNSIVLRLEMLRARLSEDAPDAEPEISVLAQEVVRLDRVVRTFLDFSRPVDVRIEELDITALVGDLVQFLSPEAARNGVAVEFVRPAERLVIRADGDLVRQALTNVAVNAIEAMENGGRLRLEIGEEGGFAVIRVSDTGPGISPENREKIFQLYFTTKSRGTGIGLAMTYRAIQLQGGNIDYTSEAGRGTTFRIALPLASAQAAVEAHA
ncbi:MAG TPA: ATP-binding protein [Bryobacteraceae bacterium]|nr:ATP-binding protein [Bryobacteraceae bacterium]